MDMVVKVAIGSMVRVEKANVYTATRTQAATPLPPGWRSDPLRAAFAP